MSEETQLMVWLALKEQLNKCKVQCQEDAWAALKEQEEYMESKGFVFEFSTIYNPQGEIVWERNK